MTAALQITNAELTGALVAHAKPATKPAKHGRDYSKQSKAMKMAWASYREWKTDWLKEYGEDLPFRRYKFNQCLRNAYQTMRIAAMGTVTVTREEAQYIGSDCLMKKQEAA